MSDKQVETGALKVTRRTRDKVPVQFEMGLPEVRVQTVLPGGLERAERTLEVLQLQVNALDVCPNVELAAGFGAAAKRTSVQSGFRLQDPRRCAWIRIMLGNECLKLFIRILAVGIRHRRRGNHGL